MIMTHIDPIKRYRSFIQRLNQHIYICPNCRQFFNENTPCECGYSYQKGRQYDYINEDGARRTMTKELICFEAKCSEFLSYLDKINLTHVHTYFIKTGWKYYINDKFATPSISDLKQTITHLFHNIRFNTGDCVEAQSGGFELYKTTNNTIICKFIARPIYVN